ncbi:cyanophycinase [Armatimonas sp.]|uniref:cyanophycinase n=1 Tax=Armatimonas sp. TaxID=1872638 RepID=UPI003750C939
MRYEKPAFAEGIPGALILCGPGSAAPEAFLTFTRLAKPLEGKFIGVKDKAPDTRELTEATGIWWEFREPPKGRVLDALKAAQARGATLGGNFAFTQTALKDGLLPDANTAIRYELPEGAALAIVGREVQLLGAVHVIIRLAATRFGPEERVTLGGRTRLADLTALRRRSRQRMEPSFPPAKMPLPNVPSGTLVIVGGGGMPQGLTQRFVEMAGGDKAIIAVIPISMPDPLPPKDGMAEGLRRAGAREVVELTGRTPEAVDKTEVLELLKRATGVWFGGGRQWRFVDAYEGTKAAKLMHEVLKRGGVIGGSSAGASIQGEYMARGNPLGPEEIIAPGYERGMGFLPGMAIDQHFTQRNRFKDMELLIKTYPQLLGVGIDEATALIVQGSVAEIVGRTRVNFYDPQKSAPESVASGKKYDLATRKVIE